MDRDEIALDAAQQIEDLFAQHHAGGRSQRFASIQRIIRAGLEQAPQPKPQNNPPQADVRGKDGNFDKPFKDYLKE